MDLNMLREIAAAKGRVIQMVNAGKVDGMRLHAVIRSNSAPFELASMNPFHLLRPNPTRRGVDVLPEYERGCVLGMFVNWRAVEAALLEPALATR